LAKLVHFFETQHTFKTDKFIISASEFLAQISMQASISVKYCKLRLYQKRRLPSLAEQNKITL